MRISLLFIAIGLLGASLVWAQPAVRTTKPAVAPAAPAASSDAKASEAAIRQAGQAYAAALNSGDFKTAASYWATDGEFVNAGGHVFKARKVVGEELANRFAAADKPQLAFNVKTLRMVTPETAVEDGSLEIKAAGGKPARRGNYSTLWVKRQGKWLIHGVHESAAAARTHEYSLTDLDWLVGHWTAQADGETVHVDCSWAPGRSFLLRDITVERAGKPRQTITQRIGLDPLSPTIKSWAFESNGGMADATWGKSGTGWQVISQGATKNGHRTSAKNIYSEIGPDGFTVESIDAKVGSHNPPVSKLKFKRVGAAATTLVAAPAASNQTAADTAARERILNSPEWRKTQRTADEWLSVQTTYSPAEVKQIRAEMAAKTAKMTAPELQNFLDDAKAKFAILLSKQAEEARLWLAQRMAVEVKATPEQLKQMRPDIVNMTAAQVEERLLKLQAERKQIKQAQQAFDAGRKQEVTAIEQADKEEAEEREAALDRAYSLDSAGGYYYGGGNVPYDAGWGGSYRY